MKTVLIVLNYNDYETTEKLLENVNGIQKIDKIVVVDNYSTDNSFEILKKHENNKIDVIRTEKNGGYAYGNNFGTRYSIQKYSPEYIFISNPDVELNEKLIEAILHFFKKKEKDNVGIVTGKMVTTSDIKIHPAWKLPTYWNCIWENLMILRKLLHINGGYYKEKYFDRKVSRVDVISGAFFAVKTETILDIGLFDEDTFLYGEENILAFKLRAKGYKNYVLNKYEYLHHHSVSISKSIRSTGKKLDLAYESRCLYLDKYLQVGKIGRIFHKVTYKVGKFNYLLIKSLVQAWRKAR